VNVPAPDLLLPDGTCLLHIGPHKTGSTAVQSAFHSARTRLAEQGVVYPGRGRQPLLAVLSVTGQPGLLGEVKPKMVHWDKLVRGIRTAEGQRVFLSSEFFAEAKDPAVERVIGDLGGPRVHVVVTLRPLHQILPSQWQQYLQNGYRMSYPEWLDGILSEPPCTPTPGFWVRHRHDQLVARWASVAGPRNVTVIVLDQSDRLRTLRVLEAMLGLPDGFLVPQQDAANRSLTRAEAEMVRQINEEFKTQAWPERNYPKFMRYGAVERMKLRAPAPDEPRIATPAWALSRAAEIGDEMAGNISALGVRVVGDISTLGKAPNGAPEVGDAAPAVPVEAAAQAMLGALVAGGAGGQTPEQILREVDAKAMTRVLMRRGQQRMRHALHRRG
jgi:hypothetical protein